MKLAVCVLSLSLAVLAGCHSSPVVTEASPQVTEASDTRQWLAGDHHVHTHYSVRWDTSVFPPKPIIGGDAIYSIPLNAQMAAHHGLSWLVITDHGGPNRAKLALEQAYPELLASRKALPHILQFYGMEFDVPGNSPGGRHATFIMPKRPSEAQQLYDIESKYNGRQGMPPSPCLYAAGIKSHGRLARHAFIAGEPPGPVGNGFS